MVRAGEHENAIKIARAHTSRHKILARYRSYHGATDGAMALTGDPRRWSTEPSDSCHSSDLLISVIRVIRVPFCDPRPVSTQRDGRITRRQDLDG